MMETSLGLPQKSSATFRNFRKMFGNVRVTFGQVFFGNRWKVVGNFRKIVVIVVIKRTLHVTHHTVV